MALTKLRLALLDHGEVQYVVAAKARVSPARLSEYANGKRRIPAHTLAKLAFVLKRDPDDLQGFVDPAEHYAV